MEEFHEKAEEVRDSYRHSISDPVKRKLAAIHCLVRDVMDVFVRTCAV